MPPSPGLLEMDSEAQKQGAAMISPIGKGLGKKHEAKESNPAMDRMDMVESVTGTSPPAFSLHDEQLTPTASDMDAEDEKLPELPEQYNDVKQMAEQEAERETNHNEERPREGCDALVGFFADVEKCICAPFMGRKRVDIENVPEYEYAGVMYEEQDGYPESGYYREQDVYNEHYG